MHDISYTRGRICKAVDHLAKSSMPMPKRAWEAYHILLVGGVHEGMEIQYAELESIFDGIHHDDVGDSLSEAEAIRGAELMLQLFDANSERRGRESVEKSMA